VILKSRILSRTSDTTETRNPCVMKVIWLTCFTYIDSEHRKIRAKQQHVCMEMNVYEQYQPEVVFKFQHKMYNRSESPEIGY
jgi:hypothetical protein